MSIIKQLDDSTINKIAAGEVVERPSGVIKELIENSIDAGSTSITVEIKEGGIAFLRITDNGCGIKEDDLDNAFNRHSTSKITCIEDLLATTSLGFRGEALSSIAAVSQVELISKTKDDLLACRYVIEGGIKKTLENIGAPDGTTLIVRNLFYNTPVRRKFLKSPQTEASYVKDIVERMSIAHPGISFKLIINNAVKLATSGNNNILDVIYAVYGRDITSNLIKIESRTASGISIEGHIGKPVVVRGNRAMENFYINKRYIKSPLLSRALEEAYAPYTMPMKFPFAALSIDINSALIDVNIHPSKMEIKFSNNDEIFNFINKTVREALVEKPPIVDLVLDNKHEEQKTTEFNKEPHVEAKIEKPISVKSSFVADNTVYAPKAYNEVKANPQRIIRTEAKETKSVPEPFEHKRIEADLPKEIVPKEIKELLENKSTQLDLFDKEDKEVKKASYKIVGQLFDTYWILQYNDNMYIIDQHAAHEKILFERLIKQIKNQQSSSQKLNPPIIVTLNSMQEATLNDNMDLFIQVGYEIEEFGGNEYNIYAIPASLPSFSKADLFIELLDLLAQQSTNKNTEVMLEKLASMSCKAAVKGNNRLSTIECQKLINDLMELENPFNCPHGRPVIISMTKYELEKKFKRII